MLEEVDRLTRLSDICSRFSRADTGHIQLQREVIPLLQLAKEAGSGSRGFG